MQYFEREEMIEMIYAVMDECDNDVHIAIEIVSKNEGIATEDLYEAYDSQW